MVRPRALVRLSTAVVVLALASSARGQDASTGAAIALFDDASRLMGEGKYAEACPKLARSQQLAPNGGTLFALADCFEKNGQLASSWVAYREAALRARAANKAEPEQRATAAAKRLEPHVSWVTIQPARPVAGLVVNRDGQPLSQAEWGVALPFDPGNHVITAQGPGPREWSTNLSVPATGQQLVVTVPDLESDGAPEKPKPEGSTQRWVGWGLGGLGVVGVVVGGAFGLKAISKNEDATSQCRTETLCSPEGLALHDEARSAATTSTLLVVIGSAALVGGIALVLTAPSTPSSSSRSVTLHAGPTSVGLTGRF